ncbi:hypothetical protein FB45DRAFT_1060526, partial [Roridomyces roridus]
MSHAELPPELVDLVVGHLDFFSDLLACARVCRSWIPIARSGLTLSVNKGKMVSFLELVQAPTATFPSTIQRLEIRLYQAASTDYSSLVVGILSRFTVLRFLTLAGLRIPGELPPLPTLTVVDLVTSEFATCAGFVRFVSKFPRLRVLKLWNTTWGEDSSEELPALPPMHLDSVSLGCFPCSVPHASAKLNPSGASGEIWHHLIRLVDMAENVLTEIPLFQAAEWFSM